MTATKPTAADVQDAKDQGEFLAHVEEGIADAKAGRVVPYEKVRRWLLSWGSGKELPPPKCP
jgi:predicted transcriptional regulator